MAHAGYGRPVLCRLCECPVADTGVPMAQLDRDKLGLWWQMALDTELDDDSLDPSWICQFCLWEARLCGENVGSVGCNWWNGYDRNQFYKKFFYKHNVIRRCHVKLPVLILPVKQEPKTEIPIVPALKMEVDHEETISTSSTLPLPILTEPYYPKVEPCPADETCDITITWENLECHEKPYRCTEQIDNFMPENITKHNDKIEISPQIKIESTNLSVKMKFSEIDNVSHGATIPAQVPILQKFVCPYCNEQIDTKDINFHMEKFHKSEAVKCFYGDCGEYFINYHQREIHILHSHVNFSSLKCPYCTDVFSRDLMDEHILIVHKFEYL